MKISIKVHTGTVNEPGKAITVKDIERVSVSNGALEVYAQRKDERGASLSILIATFAKDVWLYFEEA